MTVLDVDRNGYPSMAEICKRVLVKGAVSITIKVIEQYKLSICISTSLTTPFMCLTNLCANYSATGVDFSFPKTSCL